MTAPQQIDANDWLMSGGAKSAKFPEVGTVVKGSITTPPTLSQQTDFTTGALKTWDDGKPQMQLVVTIQTDEKDDVEDDGVRSLYVKGAMQAAVKDAIRKAGARGLEVGGTIAIKYTGDGVAKTRGMNPPKQFAAQYVPPTAKAVDDFLATPEPAAAPVAAKAAADVAPPF